MRILLITLLIGTGVTLTIVADILLKKSGWSDWRYVVAGFLVYGLIAIPVAVVFKYTEFGQLFLVWEAVAVIFGLIVASWYFKEPFTAYRLVALLLVLSALYFSYK